MDYNSILKSSFLFCDLQDEQIKEITDSSNIRSRSLQRGDKILFNNEAKCLVFLISGRLDVLSEKGEGGFVVLNRLTDGAVFGLLSVFSDEDFPTSVVASLNSEILILPKKDLIEIIEKYPKVSKKIIYFMADRINFLNKKIATFSGTRVDDRLFSYLLSKSEKEKTKVFPLNCKKCSEAINAGRASVYRAIELLANEGVINFENKIITLLKAERK